MSTAETQNDVCPDLVSSDRFGHHKSVVRSGTRYWTFETEEAKERFINAVAKGEFRRPKRARKDEH